MPICDPVPELPYSGEGTPEGNACRIAARATYLTDVLMCETSANTECCEEAEAAYIAAHAKCRD